MAIWLDIVVWQIVLTNLISTFEDDLLGQQQ
jgi:hypothetical protein